MRKFLKTALIFAISVSAPLAFNVLPAATQQMPSMPQIQHIPLNVQLAKQAIDATLYIRKNYKDRNFTDANPSDMINAMKNKGVYNKMQVELRSFGFNNPEQWSRAAVSTAVAVGFMQKGGSKDMMAQMMQMQRDSNMSAEMKAQMLATVKSITPPKANMKVAKQILADRGYAAKVDRLFGE